MMQDLPSSTTNANDISGKMDSNTTSDMNSNGTTNDTTSQRTMASLKYYLPLVKWAGSNTKTFFTSGQFRQTIRSPVQFINPRHLSIPQTVGDALTRLATNWGFYKSNYAIITFLCCFGWLFSSPSSLIVLAILFLMWLYTIKTSGQTLSLGENKYGPMQKYMFTTLITLIAMLFFGIIGTLIGGISVGSGISSLHAVCHVRPTTEHEQLRDLNDIELTNNNNNNNNNNNDTNISIKYNETITSVSNNNGEVTSVNGLEILQLSDNESFTVNDASLPPTNNDDNNQTSIFEKMIHNGGGNDGTDDDQPELGLQH